MDAKVKQLYEEAKKRAAERSTEYHTLSAEAMEGFLHGLTAVYDKTFEVNFDRIRSESTYGFAFVCGMLTKREAVKGKSYGASWQKKGLPGFLANIQRKTDRLEQIIELLGLGKRVASEEGLCETAGDSLVYHGKAVTLQNEMDRAEFQALIIQIRDKD